MGDANKMNTLSLKFKNNNINYFHHNNLCTHKLLLLAHKKGAGSRKNGRQSNSKRRGVKIFGDHIVASGNIIVRQVGTKFHAGVNTSCGNDFTLYATSDGIVKFSQIRGRRCVSVYPPSKTKSFASNNSTSKRKSLNLSKYTTR